MKVLFRNILKKLFSRKHPMRKSARYAVRAQSFLEFALLLPLLLILLLIMVELGFVLNAYLSLLDSTRQTARVYSGLQPFEITEDTSVTPSIKTKTDKLSYYSDAAALLIETLNSNSYQIKFNNPPGSVDNVLVSVIGVDVNTVPNPDTITIIRHPGTSQYWAFSTDSVNAGRTSKYANATIEGYMTKGGSTPVSTGLLIIEVYYGYEGTLQVPGIRFFNTTIGFATDANPMVLYATSVMPLSQAKP